MTHKDIWVPPFQCSKYSWNITDNNHRIVFTALCDDDTKERIMKLLNGDADVEKFKTAQVVDPCNLYLDGKGVGMFRGWGHLTGKGALALDVKTATKIHNDFMLECLTKLGEKYKLY